MEWEHSYDMTDHGAHVNLITPDETPRRDTPYKMI